jgi:hypothetical protein
MGHIDNRTPLPSVINPGWEMMLLSTQTAKTVVYFNQKVLYRA